MSVRFLTNLNENPGVCPTVFLHLHKGGGKGGAKPPPPPPPAPEPAKKASESVRRARDDNKRKYRNLSGDASTQLTGPRGLMAPAATAGSTLLGG